MSETPKKPVPRPAPESLPYWQAAAGHRLEIPQCEACGGHWFPPSRTCPHCLSPKVRFSQVSGRGKVFSFVIYDRVYHPSFAEDVRTVSLCRSSGRAARCLPQACHRTGCATIRDEGVFRGGRASRTKKRPLLGNGRLNFQRVIRVRFSPSGRALP